MIQWRTLDSRDCYHEVSIQLRRPGGICPQDSSDKTSRLQMRRISPQDSSGKTLRPRKRRIYPQRNLYRRRHLCPSHTCRRRRSCTRLLKLCGRGEGLENISACSCVEFGVRGSDVYGSGLEGKAPTDKNKRRTIVWNNCQGFRQRITSFGQFK